MQAPTFSIPSPKLCLLFFVFTSIVISQDSLSLRFTTSDFSDIQQGIPFDIQWTGANGVVNLYVVNADGDPNSNTVLTIASNLKSTQYRWTPPYLPARNIYNLRITDSADNENFSPTWSINDTISSSSSSSSSTLSAQSSSSTHAIASQTSTQTSSHSGLSTGVIAGIAVAAVLVGIGAAVGIVLFFLRRKKAKSSEKTDTGSSQDQSRQSEIGGTAISEMRANMNASPSYRNKISELASPTSSAPQELNGLEQERHEDYRDHGRRNVHQMGDGHTYELGGRNIHSGS